DIQCPDVHLTDIVASRGNPIVRFAGNAHVQMSNPHIFNGAGMPVAAVTNVVDNGNGVCRVTATGHGLVNGDRPTSKDVVGTTEVNGDWCITKIDDDTFDLTDCPYANAYVSGGTVVFSAPVMRIEPGTKWI